MRGLILTALLLGSAPALALNEGLQCVPYARALSGIEIRGDAYTWWNQAAGKYERGSRPRVGAVMAFTPYGKMHLGHVAAVSRIIDSRTILISHANWSTINGSRGHIEQNVRAFDVSEDNDWSRVRVWYGPLGDLGTTEWPVRGFIYPNKPRSMGEIRAAVSTLTGGTASGEPIQGKWPVQEKWNATAVKGDTKDAAKPAKIAKTIDARKDAYSGGFTLSGSLLKDIDKKAAREKSPGNGKGFTRSTR